MSAATKPAPEFVTIHCSCGRTTRPLPRALAEAYRSHATHDDHKWTLKQETGE